VKPSDYFPLLPAVWLTKSLIHFFNRSVPLRSVALRIGEALLVFTALHLAYRSGQQFEWTPTTYGQVALAGSVILLCMYCLDFYEPQVTTHRTHSLSRLVQALGVTMLIIAALPQGWLPVPIDSATVVFGMLLVGATLMTSRYVFAELASRPTLAESAIVWGSGPLAAHIIGELRRRPDSGIRVLGIVDHGCASDTFAGVRNLGSPDVIWTMAESGRARRIIIAIDERRGCLPVEKLMTLKTAGLLVEDGPKLYEELTGRVWLGTFNISSLLFSSNLRTTWARRALTRSFSSLFAFVALIIASPLMLVIAAMVLLDSEGPAIFRQTRIGENGRYFTLYKFRSMKVGAERAGTLAPASVDDPRCTRVGKWLRRFRLDELPQLLNILKGDMNFVGPRPFVPDQEAMLVQHIPHYRQRWAVRPGATGWAQVHRGYNASIEDNAEKLSYDLFYIKHRSLGLDLMTLLKTFKVLLLGRGGR
jgi:exopolysaccharide biosynthesis polyprenyl glycosylphosphotransferase